MNTFGLEDRILELIANYAYMWDGKDADGFSDLFAEDAIWSLTTRPNLHLVVTCKHGPNCAASPLRALPGALSACRPSITGTALSLHRSTQTQQKEKRSSWSLISARTK
jgi:hypothetical protein